MSKIFKSITKVFKSVVKFVVKIAPYALAAAAVVFTGGAALGLLPTFGAAVGGLVSSLGLSAAVTGALTGAITSAGFGAALGFVTGGEKGMRKGALMGALTGGVMGFASPSTFGITTNAAGQVTTKAALAKAATSGIAPIDSGLLNPQPLASMSENTALLNPELPNFATEGVDAIQQQAGIIGQTAQAGSQAATTAASQGIAPLADAMPVTGPSIPSVAANLPDYAAASGSGGGVGSIASQLLGGQGGVGGNLTGLVGSVLQSIGGDNPSKDEEKAREKYAKFGYEGVYSGKANPFGIPSTPYEVPQPRYYYDKASNTVIDRQQPGG
jgi:hypothetical protein